MGGGGVQRARGGTRGGHSAITMLKLVQNGIECQISLKNTFFKN